MEASWWERLTVGKLDLVLVGGAMLSKSLIQVCIDGRGPVPTMLLDLRPNYGGGNEDNGDLLLKVALSAPTLQQVTTNPWLRPRLLDTHRKIWVSLLWRHYSFLLGPGAHKVLFVSSKRLFPQSCVSSIIKSHWPPKSNSLGFLSPFARSPGWEICCGS